MNSDRTANANLAPRCQHTKLNGAPCAAPARRGRNYCVFHDAAHAKQPDGALLMIEDAMSLQYALFQVMRLLTDKAVDTRRAALMLYALQIASSNLKRLHEETQEIANSGDIAQEKSLMKELLEVLQIPETEAERMAEEHAAEMERENASSDTFTIKACACDDAHSPPADDQSHRLVIPSEDAPRNQNALGLARSGWRVRVEEPAFDFHSCAAAQPNPSLAPCALRLVPCACSLAPVVLSCLSGH
jgi:hypothetical protein